MNIEFRRKPDKEEAMLAYDFFKKNMNRIIGILAGIAVIIIIFNLYQSNYEKNKILAADKLFEIRTAYQKMDDEKVLLKGIEYIDKFSAYDSTGDILIFVAKTHIRQNNTDQAISILEKNQNLSNYHVHIKYV